MKIIVKLTLGVGLLFLLILLLAVLGTYYINALNKDTQNILVANYNTLDYSRSMIIALDESITNPIIQKKFADNLVKQQHNITEIGERELTDKLALDFDKLRKSPLDNSLNITIRKDLTDIMLLNMQAIERKSNIAKHTASRAIGWIAFTGTFCFIIAFTLLVNLPGNIANPIKELTESIKQIAEKNYEQQVHFESHNEFGELARAFNIMAKKLHEYSNSSLSKIMIEKKRIDMLINNMHDPIIGLDEKKMILFANDEAVKILGMKHEELIGQHIQDMVATNDLIRSLTQELMASAGNFIDKKPLKIYADNRESYFEKEIMNISITPTGEKESVLIGHFILLHNITLFKELDFAKTNFIATISHELKTPISTIKASLQLLENPKTGIINEEQRQLVDSIKDDSNRLLKITSELLNLSQLESGKIQLSIQICDLEKIVYDAVDAIKVQADKKGIRIDVNFEDDLPLVKADTDKTTWVFINLLTNAIRYSMENRSIVINVRKDQNKVSFSLQDFGSGIESKYQDKIFTRYFQVPGSSKSGTGLGLSISKEFIEAQGGEISLVSATGIGSTFTVTLNVGV